MMPRLYKVRRIQKCDVECVCICILHSDLDLPKTWIQMLCSRNPCLHTYTPVSAIDAFSMWSKIPFFLLVLVSRAPPSSRNHSGSFVPMEQFTVRLLPSVTLTVVESLMITKQKHTSCKSRCSYLFNITWPQVVHVCELE